MDNIMTKGFCELSADEMNEIDGGVRVKWWHFLIAPGTAFVLWDLTNCYNNGYAEMKR